MPQRDDLTAVRRVVGPDRTIRLDALPESAVADLVAEISAGEPGKDLLKLAGGASGNPLYLTELMEVLVRAKRLTVTDEGAVGVTGGSVPDSLVAAITDGLEINRVLLGEPRTSGQGVTGNSSACPALSPHGKLMPSIGCAARFAAHRPLLRGEFRTQRLT